MRFDESSAYVPVSSQHYSANYNRSEEDQLRGRIQLRVRSTTFRNEQRKGYFSLRADNGVIGHIPFEVTFTITLPNNSPALWPSGKDTSSEIGRQDGPKGGVITLVKNDITASEIKDNTGDQAEMIRTELHFKDKNITIYNCCCPPVKDHALHAMNIGNQCIVVGDFNSHSPS
ncbi:hypothetical protein ElyMa_002127000 [Elysia marginata]|uniref:Endonuclease/exonuclease/phosphatase domain-containing protein n=1 Tax=Elysia marginata TaxID=1093978 RepID=A0AAV4FJ77_9GAST|nr:hypothetical protein ElyMa_002127000 [Elysia marginata]